MPAAPARLMHCPACRDTRAVREVGKATIKGRERHLIQCGDRACELIWATPRTATAERARAA